MLNKGYLLCSFFSSRELDGIHTMPNELVTLVCKHVNNRLPINNKRKNDGLLASRTAYLEDDH